MDGSFAAKWKVDAKSSIIKIRIIIGVMKLVDDDPKSFGHDCVEKLYRPSLKGGAVQAKDWVNLGFQLFQFAV